MQATFQTRVPAPVVTISPLVVNLDELEAIILGGQSTSYTYTVSNYGLIKADAFSLTLPSANPLLKFDYDAPIGDIPANSSVRGKERDCS